MSNKILYSIRLDSDTIKKLRYLAKKEETSVSYVVRKKLKEINLQETYIIN